MAYTTINKSTDYFNTKLYTGNGGTQSITGVGHQPDWVWIKRRDSSGSHIITDAVRGTGKIISSNSNGAEFDEGSNGVSAFGTDGFSIGNLSSINTNSGTFASWNWKAGGGQGSSNTDGSINTTYTSVNTTAGFSICKWTGTGANGTIGHGLGAVPTVIFVKNLGTTENWVTYHKPLGATKYLKLNDNSAQGTSSDVWNNTAPTSSVFYVGSNTATNQSGNQMIAYCFAEKTGYSKFGSYTGNGNSDGTFIYTGFRPSWMMIKESSNAGNEWYISDGTRSPTNAGTGSAKVIAASGSGAEESGQSYNQFDIVSNGYKVRGDDTRSNGSGRTYIYMAFGQSLVGSNNVPCTAR